jgi:hypothetical protein
MIVIILVPGLISIPPYSLAVLKDDHDFLQPRGVTGRASLSIRLRGKSDCVPAPLAIALIDGGYHLPEPPILTSPNISRVS